MSRQQCQPHTDTALQSIYPPTPEGKLLPQGSWDRGIVFSQARAKSKTLQFLAPISFFLIIKM